MEVSGKIDVHDSTLVCIPCHTDGFKEQACGFCQDCQEHLCETCYMHHKRARPLRNHLLLDKDSMTKFQSNIAEAQDDTAVFCPKHKDKTLEFFCNNHAYVVCYVCATLGHKQCNVDYIPDVSENMPQEKNDLVKRMESLIQKCKSCIESADISVESLDESHKKVVEDIKLFRKEINEYIDQMETRIIREVSVIANNSKSKLETVITTCKDITKELEDSKSLLNKLSEKNKRNQLFIELKNAEKSLPLLENKEKHVLEENKTDDSIRYIRNARLIDELQTDINFGQLKTHVKPFPARTIDIQHTNTIKVKSESDKEKCNITGMVMITPSKMIVADRNNKSIKMIDAEKGSVVTKMKMSSSPIDVIYLSGKQLAVTLESVKCIQVLSYTETECSLCHRITVGEFCDGVAYCDDKFVVSSYASKKIVIVNLNGDILNIFYLRNLLNGPGRVVVSNDKMFLYISDTDKKSEDKVVQIDWECNIKNVFEEQEFHVPYGMQQLEDDTLLVCCRDSNTLLRLSNSLKRCDTIGLHKAELHKPKAITYIDKINKLYVSCASKKGTADADIVKVFDIKWII